MGFRVEFGSCVEGSAVRCRSCDYPLWKTTRRECPECGSPFAPSEYEFRPATVAFRCPHCAQAYYGTSPRGHLEPTAFDCPQCGKAITMDEMSVEPAQGFDESQTGGTINPWMARRELGLFRAWFRSVLRILGAPTEFLRGIPKSAPVSDAVLFAGITATLGGALGLLIILFLLVLKLTVGAGSTMTMSALLLQVTVAGANILVAIVSALVAGFVAHLMLVVLRGAPHGLGRSMQPILYAHGATNALNLVICSCSAVLSPIWWCVAMARMLREAQGAPLWKTTTASIIAAIVWFTASFSSAYIVASLSGGRLSGLNGIAVVTSSSTTTSGADGVRLFEDSAPFPTPLDAVAVGAVDIEDFLEFVAPAGEPVRIGSMDRTMLTDASPDALRDAGAELAARLPTGNTPFRLERAIFTYRDADQSSKAWLIIVLPSDPGDPEARWSVVRKSDRVDYDVETFAKRLVRENARRRDLKLPPLPDPSSLPDLLAVPTLVSPPK